MKQLILSSYLFITLTVFGQTKKEKCPLGQTYVPGLSSSSMSLSEGCYPDSIAKRIYLDFAKEVCEGESSWFEGELNFDSTNKKFIPHDHGYDCKWINDTVGCKCHYYWEKIMHGKVINMTENQYKAEFKN